MLFLNKIFTTINRRILFYLHLTLITYFIFLSIALFAQYQSSPTFSKDQYIFEPFLLPGGKIENTIQCMAQDSSGFLWFGTQHGLVKYDGRKYQRYLHNPLDSNSLISNYVECIYIDNDGSLWIGAFDQGFTRLDPTTQLFQRYYLKDEANKQQTIGVNAIIRHQDYIWLGTHNGLRRYNPQKRTFKSYFFNTDGTDIFNSNVFRVLFVDQQDVLWAGQGFTWNTDKNNGGLYKYQSNNDTFTIFKHTPNDKNSLSDNRVKGIFEDSNHNFWIGTMGDGLNLMDRTKNQFISFPFQANQPNQLSRPWIANASGMDNYYGQVQFIHEDVDKKLWIGSFDSGLNIYDPTSKKQIHFTNGINGLETKNIWNIFETNDKTIFICSGGDGEGKNYRVKIKKNLFPYLSVAPYLNVDEIREDQNQQIWLGGNTNLWHFNPGDTTINETSFDFKEKMLRAELKITNHQLSNLVPSLIRQFGIPTGQENINTTASIFGKPLNKLFIKAVKKDKLGNVWVGTWGDGLFRYNTKTQSIKSFKYDSEDKSGIGGDHVSVIYEDYNGNIWIGGGKEAKNLNHSFFLDRLETTMDTFNHYYLQNAEYGYPPTITEDKNGNLWYPTVLGGVHQLNTSSGEIIKYNQSNSRIPSDDIRALVLTPDDNIWMSTEKTMVRWTPDRQSFIEYGEMEGIKVDEFSYGSGYISSGNTLYFGGKGGFHYFKPTIISQKEKLATVKTLLREVVINKQDSKGINGSLIKAISSNTNLNLAHDENTFSIGFTLLDFQAPQKVYLEYQLVGQDRDWKVADNNKTASYNNLSPGHYLFKVRGANSRGRWNEKEQQLKIIINPPWYNTWWAKTLFGLVVLGFLFLIRRLELQKQAQELAKQQHINVISSKFVPNAFLQSLGRKNIMEVKLGDSVEQEVTVMFSDIRDYTSLSEKMTPEENFRFVRAFNGRMGPIIQQNKGFINQYLGDAIMAIFKESPEDALKAAIQMQQALNVYNNHRIASNRVAIKIGVGLHKGPLIMGIIGDENRMDAATISDAVNTASRIESLTKYFGVNILLSAENLVEIKRNNQSKSGQSTLLNFNLRFLGRVQLKGKKEPVGIYECFDGDLLEIKELKLANASLFEKGMNYYLLKKFADAALIFEKVIKANKADYTAQLFLSKATQYSIEGVPADWNGVEIMTFK